MILIHTCLPILGIPSSDSRNANLYFLDVVQQANTIFHLFDKQFNDHLMPLIRLVKLIFVGMSVNIIMFSTYKDLQQKFHEINRTDFNI